MGMEIELFAGKKLGVISDKFFSYFPDLLNVFRIKKKKMPEFTYSQFRQILGADKKIEDKNFITLSIPTNFNRYCLFLKISPEKFYYLIKKYNS